MIASGSTPAANAWNACARPISAPSHVTALFSDMFCALNGATRTPLRASTRHSPATTSDLPASLVAPATISPPRTVAYDRSVNRVGQEFGAIPELSRNCGPFLRQRSERRARSGACSVGEPVLEARAVRHPAALLLGRVPNSTNRRCREEDQDRAAGAAHRAHPARRVR